MRGSLFDTNVWIAVLFDSHPFHQQAQRILLEATPKMPAVFCRSTQQSFLRLVSTSALLKTYNAERFTNREALVALNALLSLPQIAERNEPPAILALWHRLAARDTASPKIWMDAYLAAFAINDGLRIVSLDNDFKQYVANGLDLLLLNPNS